MNLIRRDWTPGDADEWTKEDWITIIISPLAYILLMIGLALSLLLIFWGVILLVLGIILTILMHWIIDPKLKMISGEYEKRQHEYLIEIEKKTRWEDQHG